MNPVQEQNVWKYLYWKKSNICKSMKIKDYQGANLLRTRPAKCEKKFSGFNYVDNNLMASCGRYIELESMKTNQLWNMAVRNKSKFVICSKQFRSRSNVYGWIGDISSRYSICFSVCKVWNTELVPMSRQWQSPHCWSRSIQ